VILHVDVADFTKRRGVEETNGGGAVREDEVFAVGGEAPALAVVVQGAQQAEAEAVVDEDEVRLPGELDEGAAPRGEAFGKILRRDGRRLQHAAGVEIVHAQRGAAVEAGAFVEMPVDEDQALRVGVGIVRIRVNDAVGVVGEGGGRGREDEDCEVTKMG